MLSSFDIKQSVCPLTGVMTKPNALCFIEHAWDFAFWLLRSAETFRAEESSLMEGSLHMVSKVSIHGHGVRQWTGHPPTLVI